MKKLLVIAVWVISILVSIKIYEFMLLHWLKKEFEKFKEEYKKPDRVDYSGMHRSVNRNRVDFSGRPTNEAMRIYVQKRLDQKMKGFSIKKTNGFLNIFSDLKKCYQHNGQISVADLLELNGMSSNLFDSVFGWDDLDNDIRFERKNRVGYTFKLSPIKYLGEE